MSDQVGVDDCVEQVDVDAVVDMGVHIVVTPSGVVSEMERVMVRTAGLEGF